MNYKHGDKVRNWRYRLVWVENPKYRADCWFQPKGEYQWSEEKVYYGKAYRFRMDPVTGGYRHKNWTKYTRNKGSGKCWKREWYAARLDAKECYEDYGITFKTSDRIDYKYGYNHERGWKRTKKRKQWM